MVGEIVEFKPEHFDLIVPREIADFEGVEGWSLDGSRAHALNLALSGPAFSYRSPQGDILAISGATFFWPGVGWGWALIDRRAFQDTVGMVHAFLRGIDGLMQQGGFHRLQATVRADYDRGLRLAHALRLTDDVVRLRKFGRDGSDHILFAKLANHSR